MIELIETKDLCDRIQRSSAWFRKWKSLGKSTTLKQVEQHQFFGDLI